MIEIGRLCVKTAGRDAGHTCVVVDVISEHTVLIDGDVRRRPCNPDHLEPLADTADVTKGASHADVEKAFKKLGLPTWTTKPKKLAAAPRKQRKAVQGKEGQQVGLRQPAPLAQKAPAAPAATKKDLSKQTSTRQTPPAPTEGKEKKAGEKRVLGFTEGP